MGLVSLVYISLVKKNMMDDELRDILQASRQNNAEKNITGMLLYRDGMFI